MFLLKKSGMFSAVMKKEKEEHACSSFSESDAQ